MQQQFVFIKVCFSLPGAVDWGETTVSSPRLLHDVLATVIPSFAAARGNSSPLSLREVLFSILPGEWEHSSGEDHQEKCERANGKKETVS